MSSWAPDEGARGYGNRHEHLGHVIKAVKGTVSISPKRAWRLRDAYAPRFPTAVFVRNGSGSDFGACWFLFLGSTTSALGFWKGLCICAGSLLCACSSVVVGTKGTEKRGVSFAPRFF